MGFRLRRADDVDEDIWRAAGRRHVEDELIGRAGRNRNFPNLTGIVDVPDMFNRF